MLFTCRKVYLHFVNLTSYPSHQFLSSLLFLYSSVICPKLQRQSLVSAYPFYATVAMLRRQSLEITGLHYQFAIFFALVYYRLCNTDTNACCWVWCLKWRCNLYYPLNQQSLNVYLYFTFYMFVDSFFFFFYIFQLRHLQAKFFFFLFFTGDLKKIVWIIQIFGWKNIYLS